MIRGEWHLEESEGGLIPFIATLLIVSQSTLWVWKVCVRNPTGCPAVPHKKGSYFIGATVEDTQRIAAVGRYDCVGVRLQGNEEGEKVLWVSAETGVVSLHTTGILHTGEWKEQSDAKGSPQTASKVIAWLTSNLAIIPGRVLE